MPSVTTTTAADRSNVGAIRRDTERALTELRLAFPEDLVETAKLLVSEVVTNAILHGSPEAGGELRIVWSALPGGMLKVLVTDQSRTMPHLETAGQCDEHGRGLDIVRRLATNSGWYPEPDGGKTVWFTLLQEEPAARPSIEAALANVEVPQAVLRAHGLGPRPRRVPDQPEAIPPHHRGLARLRPTSAA
ncbi:ATP-binding protein [Kitasatospora sp. NPDC097605]|uniref:ATP-binding protein n=1 Tax=Kitasatospora sp. NPDC097605 TaxID=3157226 RepID=UPI0033269055